MGSIQVIGARDAVMGLGLLGLEGSVVSTALEAERALDAALQDPTVALILLTEPWAERLQERVAEIMIGATGPTVVEIPAPHSTGSGDLHQRVERSLGAVLGV